LKTFAVWYLLYNIVLTIAFLLALPLLPVLACCGARYRSGLAERLGFHSDDLIASLSGARPIWIHAASVGEVRSALALVSGLKARVLQRKVLLSTFTASGNRLARQSGAADVVVFLPLDLWWIVRRALAKFDPSLLVVIETEIWPNLLRQAHRRGVPTLLLSGRLSAKSLARYRVFKEFFRRALGCFSALGMQSSEDAVRIVELGAAANKVSVVGTLKATPTPGHESVSAAAIQRNGKPLLVAGSTHQGEEESVLDALAALRPTYPNLNLVIAPRHPERFDAVARLLAERGLIFQRRSQVREEQWFEKEILLLDTVGELVDFFAAADIAFVGGSLVQIGGHNILEPARLAKPILFGPHMEHYQTFARAMVQEGAALEVGSGAELARALGELLSDTDKRRQMGQRAAAIAAAHEGAFGSNLSLAERYL
jgi:3-deoxy-D-manno-octulosonic-acid transferase